MRIEDALLELQQKGLTIVLATNLVQQARRLGDRTAFLNLGRLVEVARNEIIFSDTPAKKETYEYVNGMFG
jgi:phosphate transport system ATP-binding protein